MPFNVSVGWLLIALGFLTGGGLGLAAQREDFLGGYNSRRRRLARLGHIALTALGALNVVWPLTTTYGQGGFTVPAIGVCFLIGGLTMGPGCFLTAWKWRLRGVLTLPATALSIGALLACWESIT